MLDRFYNWLDPKILKLEKWVNQQVVMPDKLDIDLDKVKKGEVRSNPVFRQPPNTGEYGPFTANLQGAVLLSYMVGPGSMEAFGLYQHGLAHWWRHRDAGTTEDFKGQAFGDMEEFFNYVHGDDKAKWWECVLRTKAILEEDTRVNNIPINCTDTKEYMRQVNAQLPADGTASAIKSS